MANKEEEQTPKIKLNLWVMFLVVVLFLLFSVFIVRPGIVGYSVYQQIEDSELTLSEYGANIQALSSEMEKLETNLSAYATFNRQLLKELSTSASELTDCKVDNEKYKTEIGDLEEELDEIEGELKLSEVKIQEQVDKKVDEITTVLEEEKNSCLEDLGEQEADLSTIQQDFDLFVENMAKSVCCKQKVDNPDIQFYDIEDDTLKCLEQGVNGTKELSC